MNNNPLKIVTIFLVIIHSFFFFLSYGNYSTGVVSLLFYLLMNIWYFRAKENFSLVSYEFFFFISFFLSCIVFPLLPLDDSEVFWITKIAGDLSDTSKWRFFNLSLVGYYSYLLCLQVTRASNNNLDRVRSMYLSDDFVTIANILALLSIVYFYIKGGFNVLKRYTGEESYFLEYGSALAYITMFYTVGSVAVVRKISHYSKVNFSSFLSTKNSLFLLNSFLILPILLLSGYRSLFMQLVLPLIYLYILFIKKINNKQLLFLFAIGFLAMLMVGILRVGEKANSGHDIVYFLRDFAMEDVAGIWLVDYTDRNGPTGGSNALLSIVSFIPFLGGLLQSILGESYFALSSSLFFTFSFDTNGSGLGTNIIGDLYYTFGYSGVVLMMGFLGFFVKKMSYHGSIYSLVCYALLIGNSVFSTRVEFFSLVRTLGFSVIIVWIYTMICGAPRYYSSRKH